MDFLEEQVPTESSLVLVSTQCDRSTEGNTWQAYMAANEECAEEVSRAQNNAKIELISD